jgi:calcineurin-like phosphoesterase family protein
MDRWVVSDTHFDHLNIIGYTNRPFANVDEMNNVLIKNWNSVIARDDIVYILGDFCFGNKTRLKEIVSALNGRKILVLGNHDKLTKTAYYEAGFETVTKSPIIVDADFILSHQPIQGDMGKFFNIHGHRHKLPTEAQCSPRHFDIGVDDHNFFPHKLDKVEKTLYRGERKQARVKTITIKSAKKNIWGILRCLPAFFTKR